jgi:uncharacterized protein
MSPKSKSPKKKTSAARRPAKKKSTGYSAKAALVALLLLGFLVVSLVLLSQFGRQSSSVPHHDSASERQIGTQDIRVEIDSLLLHAEIPLASVQPLEGPGLLVQAAVPDDSALETLQRRLQRLDPQLRLDLRPSSSTLHILRATETLFFIRFEPSGPEESLSAAAKPLHPSAPAPPPGARPRLAIIMDDLGRDMAIGRALAEIELPITFSILPGERNAARIAELAHRHGREVLIHIPMEPQGYPLIDPGDDALLVDFSADEIQARMRSYMARVPHAVGANNHMGSRFTESLDGMQSVLEVMRDANLFFIDSLTSARSVGFKEARRSGMPAAARDIFLDNVAEEGAIAAQMRKLTTLALRNGSAIGICHPYPATLEFLRRQVTELEKLGIDVVPVSELLVR